jgi:beta-lactamase class A
MNRQFWTFLTLMILFARHADAADTLAGRLTPLIDAHEGDVAVCVKNLRTGETFTYRENAVMPTASLIKLPIMIEAYRQAEEKTVDLAAMVVLKDSDKVPGSGILTDHFSGGASFPLRDAVHLMIAFSDNTATNLVLDAIGIKSTAETMERMGYPNTKAHSKVYRRETSVFPDRSARYGIGSTTAAEMVRLCEALHNGEVVSEEASKAMLKHMKACDDKIKIPRFLPEGTSVAFKTGSVNDARTAAGIITTPGGPVALCVLTEKNKDQRWNPDNAGDLLIATISREVYLYFGEQAKIKPASDEKSPKSASSGD